MIISDCKISYDLMQQNVQEHHLSHSEIIWQMSIN